MNAYLKPQPRRKNNKNIDVGDDYNDMRTKLLNFRQKQSIIQVLNYESRI